MQKNITRIVENYFSKFNNIVTRFSPMLKEQKSQIANLINALKSSSLKSILIAGPYVSDIDVNDGYQKRASIVDTVIGNFIVKIYAWPYDKQNDSVDFIIEQKKSNTYVIRYNMLSLSHIASLNIIIKQCSYIYCHSIAAIHERNFTSNCAIKILDLHGAIPEEFRMAGNNWLALKASRKEAKMLRNADTIVCVSNAMVDHIRRKYPRLNSDFIVLPILDPRLEKKNDYPTNRLNTTKSNPRVIYAGGLQIWQNIPLIQDLIIKTGRSFDYTICVPNPAAFMHNSGIPNDVHFVLSSCSTKELCQIYKKSDFGLLLRDDSIVNEVSCPTKLAEYLYFGVIPVLRSTKIGDFARLGMKFVRYDEFKLKRVPSKEECEIIRSVNMKVLKKLQIEFQAGRKKLRKLICIEAI